MEILFECTEMSSQLLHQEPNPTSMHSILENPMVHLSTVCKRHQLQEELDLAPEELRLSISLFSVVNINFKWPCPLRALSTVS